KKADHPLLLGITASPGANIERIEEIQENLQAFNIELRDESSDDVKQYIHDIQENWEIIPLSQEFKEIITILDNLFRKTLEGLKELNIINSALPRNNPRRELLKLDAKVNEKYAGTNEEDRTEYFRARALVGNSIRISHAVELIETQGIPSLSKYIEKQLNKIQMGQGSRALKELMYSEEMTKVVESLQILQEKKIIHPKIEKLKEIISEEISKNPNNRILVFSHFRVTARIISEELNKVEGVRGHWFVGQSSMKGDKGLSQKEQIEIMRSFREGTYNTLISTSVAEEGLDIGECELVVFYDAVPSAIRLIQRKGRTGRRKEGKVIMLIAEGTRDEAYRWASKKKSQKMKRIIQRLDTTKDKKKEQQKGIMDYLKEAENKEVEQIKEEITKREEGEEEKITEEKEGVLKIICDSRERNTVVIKELINKGIELGFERLEFGDYICSDQVIVERKTVEDFVNSIFDKRLFSQSKILVESCAKPVIILEGDLNLYSSSLHPHAIAGAIASLITDFRIPIVYTKSQKETAELLYIFARREQEERKRRISIGKRKGLGLKYQLESTVASLPHVDHKIATRLLKHFGSVQDIVTAKLEDFFEIRGIGEKIASDIIDYIYANYNEIESGEDIEGIKDQLEFLKKEEKEKNIKKSKNEEIQ
ncbi:MAG: ERCC4 domain-containing protein, partial [Candidatus Thorarchaeota archaeon]